MNNMEPSKPGHLNIYDMERWARNTLIFSAPALIAFLMAYQSNGDLKVASGMFTQALIAALIDLLRKYKAGE